VISLPGVLIASLEGEYVSSLTEPNLEVKLLGGLNGFKAGSQSAGIITGHTLCSLLILSCHRENCARHVYSFRGLWCNQIGCRVLGSGLVLILSWKELIWSHKKCTPTVSFPSCYTQPHQIWVRYCRHRLRRHFTCRPSKSIQCPLRELILRIRFCCLLVILKITPWTWCDWKLPFFPISTEKHINTHTQGGIDEKSNFPDSLSTDTSFVWIFGRISCITNWSSCCRT
jgi:hypothetical protein